MEHVAQRTIVQNHDLAQVWFYRAQILDERPVPERAVLPVVPRRKVLAVHLEPVDDGVGVFLHGGGEDDKIVPFAYLYMRQLGQQKSCKPLSSVTPLKVVELGICGRCTFFRNSSQCGRLCT